MRSKASGVLQWCLLYTASVTLAIDLDLDTALKLRALAQAQGRSVEDLVGDVLREFAGKYQRPHIPGIGEFDSGVCDTSALADEILRDAARN